MSMNYLNEGKRYYRRRTPIIDESQLMEKESLLEYNEFLKENIKNLETELQLLKKKLKKMTNSVRNSLETEYKQMKSILENPSEKDKCINFKKFDGRVELDELYELSRLIHNIKDLEEHIGGSSYEGNGVNFNFTWKDKPFLMRIELDDFHYKVWKEMGLIK